jgi:hypothetical protein
MNPQLLADYAKTGWQGPRDLGNGGDPLRGPYGLLCEVIVSLAAFGNNAIRRFFRFPGKAAQPVSAGASR